MEGEKIYGVQESCYAYYLEYQPTRGLLIGIYPGIVAQ